MKAIISLLLAACLLCLTACAGSGGTSASGGEGSSSAAAGPRQEGGSGNNDESGQIAENGENGGSSSQSGASQPDEPAEYRGVLSLYAFENLFPQDVLEDFTRDTGYKVAFTPFDFDETMLKRLKASGGEDYDLVVADDYVISSVLEENLAEKLDRDRLENLENIDSRFTGLYYDEQDGFTVPFGAGIQTIVYNPEKVDFEITSFGDLWDDSLRDSVGAVSNYRVLTGVALKALGESFNSEDGEAIAAAGEKLKALAGNIHVILDGGLETRLVEGEISAAVMYSAQMARACREDSGLRAVYPSEGVGCGVQVMFIPAKAPTAQAAYAFIDYILRPEIAARCFEHMGLCSTNAAAAPYISPELQDALVIPAAETADRIEMICDVSPQADEEYRRIWNEFLAELQTPGQTD